MNPLDMDALREFVNQNISRFHQDRVRLLEKMDLFTLLKKKNPYLFRAKNITAPSELINELLNAVLSSTEEKLFGEFLEDVAIFVASQTCGAHKSTAPGVDFEFAHKGAYYIVSVKSGTNWGNSSQQSAQEEYFKEAVKRLKQSRLSRNIQPVLGCCYGKSRTTFLRGYTKIVGQNFWYFISEDPQLYQRIIEPLGDEARRFNDAFLDSRQAIVTQFTMQLKDLYCLPTGEINWATLIEFNSGNLDLNMLGGLTVDDSGF
jgi:hypothetical protein